MATKSTSSLIPQGLERATAVLHYNNYSVEILGEDPIEHLRLQCAGSTGLRPLERTLTIFTLYELRRARRDLHWRDVEYSWRAHNRSRGRRRWTDDKFWDHLLPALAVGVLECTFDQERALTPA